MKARLSKEAEQKMMDALGEAVTLVEEGMSPDQAMAKVASSANIPAGHISLMTSAYNTGRMEDQRRQSNDVMDKVSAFPLADPGRVLEIMYPEKVKTAAALHREGVCSDAYTMPPPDILQRSRRRLELRCEPDLWYIEKEAAAPTYLNNQVLERAYKRAQHLRGEIPKVEAALHATLEKMALAREQAVTYFRKLGSDPYPVVRDNLISLYGDEARLVCKHLERDQPHLCKQAAKGHAPFHAGREPYRQLLTWVGLAKQALAEQEKLVQCQQQAREAELEVYQPWLERQAEHSLLPAESLKEAAAGGNLLSFVLGSTMAQELGKELGKGKGELKEKYREKILDPYQETEIRNIQTEAMLNNLIANDDVISTYDPNEVLTHFNEISQLAPRAANQTGLMRTMLRKRLQQGSFDPYEVKMMVDIENGLKERDTPEKNISLMGSGGLLGSSGKSGLLG